MWLGHTPSVKYFRIFGRKCYIKRDDDVGKFDPRSDEGMFLGYSLKRKAYRCFNHRTKTIVECANVKVNEKFGFKERMMDYNSDEGEENPRIVRHSGEFFLDTNNDLHNDVPIVEKRGGQRVEIATPTPNKNLINNHPAELIIRRKDKGLMTRNRVNEELCLIY